MAAFILAETIALLVACGGRMVSGAGSVAPGAVALAMRQVAGPPA